MTLAIAHKEGNTVILDMVRERRPPFSPEAVVEEFANELKNYRITTVVGDRYAGEWPRERFRLHGVNYEVADKSKSELYVALLPSVNSRAVDLLDDDRLVNQLVCLERRTARGGRDSVDHPRGAHDDLANAAAGALWLASTKPASWNRDRPMPVWQPPPGGRRYAGQSARMDGSVTCDSALAFPPIGSPQSIGAQAWQKVCNLQRSDEVKST